MTEKICPILAIAGTLDAQGNSSCSCQKEKCQLWVECKYQTHSEGELVLEGEDITKLKDVKSHDSSHCGLIK